jgi:SAM-dependent methyltransferase
MNRRLAVLKGVVKRRAGWLVPAYSYVIWRFVIRPRWRKLGMGVFAEHYRRNSWGNRESVSGDGSTLAETAAVRDALPDICRDYDVRTILDAPCGDFNWLRSVDLPVAYIGADIVAEIVAANQDRFATDRRSFVRLDLTTDPLPAADLVLCRDCLFHFSFAHIHQALANIRRSGARLLLTTTNPSLGANRDIVTGEWRPLNLQAPPFSLRPPLLLINERCPSPYAADKHLALWRVADI